jgi:hypothetical protein
MYKLLNRRITPKVISNCFSTTSSQVKLWNGDSKTTKKTSNWFFLSGFKKFTSRKDVERYLLEVKYKKITALVDNNLDLTGNWAFQLNEDSDQNYEEIYNLTVGKRSKNNIGMARMSRDIKDRKLYLASEKGIDNKCLLLKYSTLALGLDELNMLFENFELDQTVPFIKINNSTDYIVKFADSSEARRAVLEKCFTPINGTKCSLIWYDI